MGRCLLRPQGPTPAPKAQRGRAGGAGPRSRGHLRSVPRFSGLTGLSSSPRRRHAGRNGPYRCPGSVSTRCAGIGAGRNAERAAAGGNGTGLHHAACYGHRTAEPESALLPDPRAAGAGGPLPRPSPHLRHLLLGLGIPPHIVRDIAGHSALDVTMNIYAHAEMTEKRAAPDRLGTLLDDDGCGSAVPGAAALVTVRAVDPGRCRCRCRQRRETPWKGWSFRGVLAVQGVAPPAGLEPAAKRLEGACSIH